MSSKIDWHFDIEQRSDEWFALRRGLFTASNAKLLITRSVVRDIGIGKGAVTYANKKIAEVLWPDQKEETYQSPAMERGQFLEPFAISAYERHTGHEVTKVGFIKNNLLNAGCSPDGIINGEDSGIEVKCKSLDQHVNYLINPVDLYDDHKEQVQLSMMISGLDKWVMVHYAPTGSHELVIYEAQADHDIHERMKEQLQLFNNYITETINKINANSN